MTSRLPPLPPEALDEERRRLYEEIVGRRGTGVQHFRLTMDDGTLTGPFNAMLHAPAVGGPLSRLGEALRFEAALTPRQREIAILTVAAARRSDFEWYAHQGIGRAAGLEDEELEAVRSGDGTAFADPVERCVHDVTGALLARRPIDDAAYRKAEVRLGLEGLVTLATLVGYYELLASLLDLFEIGVPEGEPPFTSRPS